MTAFFAVTFVGFASAGADAVAPTTYAVGVSKVDVTPSYPVRLHGFGFRRAESEGVKQHIFVKALVIGGDNPFILLTADNLGVPRWMTAEVAAKLAKHGVARDRLCICATHTHTAPMLEGIAPTIFGMDLSPNDGGHVKRYTAEFADALVRAAEAALADRKPSTLSWGVGSLGLAKNRRPQGGPVDHDLSVMLVKDPSGKVRATFSSYACHCVTLSFNQISGDWAGCAAADLETMFPGSVALIAVGCGADSNPMSGVTGGKWDVAERQGREYAEEVRRVSQGFLAPLSGVMSVQRQRSTLPLADLPSNDDWTKKAQKKDAVGHHARVQQKRLAEGKRLRTTVDYEVCVWQWGDALAMAFLPGEVVVDYSLRLKKELDARRLWINAYANDDPCYIPSERVLKEGGYEGEFAMVYYDLPTKFRPGLENVIIDAVKQCAGERMRSPFEAAKVQTRPRSPQQSRASIRVGENFAVDLVAAEPLVVDPVAIAFGPDGRLWVAEMNDYPSGRSPHEPGGRIRILEDRDGDGVFETATTFLSGIPFPTGITVWRNGVLICAAPDILFAEDTDGDGKADVVRKVFSGFATHNFQARVNSLEYGLDGWLYGSCGLFGGEIRNEQGKVVHLNHRDFRCNPDLGVIESAAGSTQQGRVRNDAGDWFGCDNTNLAWHYPLPADLLSRNPHVVPPLNRVTIPDAAAARLIPASSPQMMALSGPVGNATAACGIGVYRDALFGVDFDDNLFTCEPVHNCLHRMQLEQHGSTFVGHRPKEEDSREFLASTDPWFRPVQVRTGTDGSLWVVDMYRYVIEHPMWIPPEDREKHDLRAGSTMGRIYRVRPQSQAVRPLPKWSPEKAAEQMASTNGAVRDLAMQQIIWGDQKTAAPALERLVRDSASPAVRAQALCTLGELERSGAAALTATGDPSSLVRRHAVRLLGADIGRETSLLAALKLINDPDPLVRLQAAVSLGGAKGAAATDALAALASRPDADQFLRAAVLAGVNAGNVAKATKQAMALGAPPEVIKALVATAVGFGKEPELDFLATLDDGSGPTAFAALEGLLQGLKQNGSPRTEAAARLTPALGYALRVVGDQKTNAERRVACLRLFGRIAATQASEAAAVAAILSRDDPATVQNAAIEAVGRVGTRESYSALVANWSRLSPMQRRAALDILLQSAKGVAMLVEAIEKKTVSSAELDASRRDRLVRHADQQIATRAVKLFAPLAVNRESVIAAYRKIDEQSGDAARGKAVFAKNCAGCHRLDDVGFAVGPDLAAVALKPPSYLLTEILDPSRNLDARYVGYTVLTADGRTLTGLLAGETESSIVLLGQDGRRTELLRSECERIVATGKSLMPEGLEQQIPPAAMADLLAFVRRRLPPAKSFHGNDPKPIALEDGRYSLFGRYAELRGPSIRYQVPQFVVAYWQSPEDWAAWDVDLAKFGRYRVEIEYGCPESSAGNRFELTVDSTRLTGRVAATGDWEKFQRVAVGEVELAAGRRRVALKPLGPNLKDALLDLRAIYLTPIDR